MQLRDTITETANDIGAVETLVTFTFPSWKVEVSVWCSRYIADKLKAEDWQQAKQDVQAAMDGAVTHLALHGVLPSTCADELNLRAQMMMRQAINTAFRHRNVAEGNLAFVVDPKLSGEYYRS